MLAAWGAVQGCAHRPGGLSIRCFDRLQSCLRAASSTGQQAPAQTSELAVTKRVTLDVPLSTGRSRVCVLGTGWAAARLLRDLDSKLFDFVVRLRDRLTLALCL